MERIFTPSRFLYFFFIALFSIGLYNHSQASTYTVSNSNDSGPGSLRAAITGASSGDSIYFNAIGPINLTTSITFSNPGVTLNGFNAPGAGPGVSKVIVTGSIATAFMVSAANVTIRGITFQGFTSSCIEVYNGADFNIHGCFFGTDNTGTSTVTTNGRGIYVHGTSYGIIGGSSAGAANVFYCSNTASYSCIEVYLASTGNILKISGNKIGTNYAGTASFNLGTNAGIKLSYSSNVTIGGTTASEGNMINGCITSSGIYDYPDTGTNSNITIQNNKIGTISANFNGILLSGGTHINYNIANNQINKSNNYGIDMSGVGSVTTIKITANSFSNNGNGAINSSYAAPTISSATTAKIMGGNAGNGGKVEIYKWDGLGASSQGSTFITTVTADGSGNWFYYGTFAVGDQITATATPTSGNAITSQFCAAVPVAACTTTVNAGADLTICATSSTVNLSGSTSGGTAPQWTIPTGAGSLSNTTVLNPTYTLNATEQSAAGNLTLTFQLTVSTATCAATISDQVNVTITPKPVVSAGANQTYCANATGGVSLNGTVTNATGGAWSGGAGTFANATSLNTTYTPSAGELSSAGNIVLTLTSTGNGTCTAITSQKTISITAAPTVNAGANQTVCATAPTLTLSGSVTVATGGQWTTSGNGSFTSPTSLNTTYNFTAAEKTAGSVVLTLTSTGNGTCSAVTSQKSISFNAAPVANAGPDQSACVPASTVSLIGTANNAVAVQWTTTGAGAISNGTTLNATYAPTAAESNTTTALNISFSLVASGSGGCAAVTDVMTLTITPASAANAGSDLTMCANATNISLSGSTTGATSSVWSTSGSGTFTNPSSAIAVYTPSTADRTAGSVTLTLTANGCGNISDAMVLSITPCLLDAKLKFDTPNLFQTNEAVPFKHSYSTNSAGTITYTIKKASTLNATSCATIDANGYVTLTCVDTLRVTAYQAAKAAYGADTAYYTLYVGKAVTNIVLESRGGAVSDTFHLQVKTNYDQPLTYSVVGGDLNAISITSDGLITALNVGSAYVSAHAAGDANYQSADANNVLVTIYPNLTRPVAVNDTLHMLIAEQKTIRLADNDYGTTASINLSPMLIDIDAENAGLQTKYFRPGIGIFTIDSTGLLTFSAFEAFIGTDSIQYTITDANGLVSNKASLVLMVKSPVDEIALKANEIITANGDNLNETLVIGYTDLNQGNDLLIVDAAGNKLFYAKDYQNNWRATDASGRDLGNGVYYFIFREFDHAGTVKRQLKGNFTVLR